MAQIDPPPDLTTSRLVVAHPDDEVLWFSSVVDRVGQVVLCFEDCDDYPHLGPARRAVLDAYPLPSVKSLRLPEPCSVQLVDWSRPEPDAAGLRLNAAEAPAERIVRYQESFHTLRAALAQRLRGASAVFTHNAWGEYGHPDHVQVARVVESLRRELGFRLFHSGYIAHRTMPLAGAVVAQLGDWFELPTQPAAVACLEALYREHGCWTWPTDHERFATETFLEAGVPLAEPGSGFRLNCVTP
jgi:LmbE family N-acetylglucosaminyl deacetylase